MTLSKSILPVPGSNCLDIVDGLNPSYLQNQIGITVIPSITAYCAPFTIVVYFKPSFVR